MTIHNRSFMRGYLHDKMAAPENLAVPFKDRLTALQDPSEENKYTPPALGGNPAIGPRSRSPLSAPLSAPRDVKFSTGERALIEERARQLMAKQLGVNSKKITPESRFREDLGADSLDALELIMDIESDFGIDIPDEDAERFQNINDMISYMGQNSKLRRGIIAAL